MLLEQEQGPCGAIRKTIVWLCSADRDTHDRLTDAVSACVQQHTCAGGTLLLALTALQEAAEALTPQVTIILRGLADT